MKLPEFLEDAIRNNTTSLGSHPAFPPEEEDTFIGGIIRRRYEEVMGETKVEDIKTVAVRLNKLVTECKKLEENSKEALENLCSTICAEIFNIPDDTITINGKLVAECDMSKYRMTPEPTQDFTFNDIEDMKSLSDEIYKRRMIDALISGAALYYSSNVSLYVQEIYKINPQLPQLYSEIFKYNNILLFNQKDTIKNIENANTGKVDVNVGNENEKIIIDAEGCIFPILLEYVIRGLLETASLQGLPKDKDRAEYVMSKADYRLAENWDMRLGVPLWNIIASVIEDNGKDVTEVGSNFIIMTLSELSPSTFNDYLQNTFKKTNKGVMMTKELVDTIMYNKEVDDFNNFIQVQNDKFPINDDADYSSSDLMEMSQGCFTKEELLEMSKQ